MTEFLTFGAMADPMTTQLEGYGLDEKTLRMIQRAHDSIVYLRIHGLLTDAESRRAEKRVVKWIDEEYQRVRPHEGGAE